MCFSSRLPSCCGQHLPFRQFFSGAKSSLYDAQLKTVLKRRTPEGREVLNPPMRRSGETYIARNAATCTTAISPTKTRTPVCNTTKYFARRLPGWPATSDTEYNSQSANNHPIFKRVFIRHVTSCPHTSAYTLMLMVSAPPALKQALIREDKNNIGHTYIHAALWNVHVGRITNICQCPHLESWPQIFSAVDVLLQGRQKLLVVSIPSVLRLKLRNAQRSTNGQLHELGQARVNPKVGFGPRKREKKGTEYIAEGHETRRSAVPSAP